MAVIESGPDVGADVVSVLPQTSSDGGTGARRSRRSGAPSARPTASEDEDAHETEPLRPRGGYGYVVRRGHYSGVELVRLGRIGLQGARTAWHPGLGDEVERPGGGAVRSGDAVMSWKSRRGLRLAVQWLPWERLGRRMVYIVLTYPGEWGRYVPDGQALRRHRRDFFERWYRRWGERVTGLWSVEFQVSGRPHLNVYCKVPDIVPDAEYEELVEFTRHVAGLELANGKYEGRRRAGFPSRLEGDFVHWGLEAWSECVGSTVRAGGAHVRRDKWHHHKGFEPRVFNYRRDETELDRRRVGEYLAREAGKAIQKRAPGGFGPVTAWWRYCGPGFRPEYLSEELPFAVGAELSRRMERWVRLRMRALGLDAGDRDKRLFGAGVAAFDMTPDQLVRLERWAWRAGVRKAAAGRLTKRGLLDRETGELLWQPAGRIGGATGSLGVGVS